MAIDMISDDVNEALTVLNGCTKTAAKCKEKLIVVGDNEKKSDWYDRECRAGKVKARNLLKKYRRSLLPSDRDLYRVARREYKNMLKRKQKQYNESLMSELHATIYQ